MVSSHQTFGQFAVWNPHWHTIVLEGGFDRSDRLDQDQDTVTIAHSA
jgi:hypothetical protein